MAEHGVRIDESENAHLLSHKSFEHNYNSFEYDVSLGKLDTDLPELGKQQSSSPQDSGEGQTSFFQALFNAINGIVGPSLLALPYALKTAGWLGLIPFFVFAATSFYTSTLIIKCIREMPAKKPSYPDLAEFALGNFGRHTMAVMQYCQLLCQCSAYIILEGENLAELFPNVELLGVFLTPKKMMVISTLVLLPTLLLRNLRQLSFLSFLGMVTVVIVLVTIIAIGFSTSLLLHPQSGTLINWIDYPIVFGLVAYSYAGHAGFPSLYNSMRERSQWTMVMTCTWTTVFSFYCVNIVVSYLMFGDSIKSMITQNLVDVSIVGKIVTMLVMILPFLKFSLTLLPFAESIEKFICGDQTPNFVLPLAIRMALCFTCMTIALLVPYFSLMYSFIGSMFSVCIFLIFPCLFYYRIFADRLGLRQKFFIWLLIVFGIIIACLGTVSSVVKIISKIEWESYESEQIHNNGELLSEQT